MVRCAAAARSRAATTNLGRPRRITGFRPCRRRFHGDATRHDALLGDDYVVDVDYTGEVGLTCDGHAASATRHDDDDDKCELRLIARNKTVYTTPATS